MNQDKATEESVGWYMNIVAAWHMMGMWLIWLMITRIKLLWII